MLCPIVRGRATFVCVAGLSLLLSSPAFAQVDVTTHHNDVGRSGATLTETTLTVTNVNATQFGKIFERVVDDQIYGQPLYVANVDIPGVGIRNVVYVATVSNSVYAFDADTPAAATPLWQVSYINPPTVVPVHRTEVGQACGNYLDFSGNIGIVGTPVIDPASHTMYFVVRTKENSVFTQRLHAVDIRNGAPRPGSPMNIQASVAGTGDGSNGQGNLPFNPRTQNQRSGLLLMNGVVYIAWGSHCEDRPYHGWILGYDAASLSQVMVFNTTPNGRGGGIWQSGQGLTADPSGNIYALTGSGTFDGNTGGSNFGLSFLKISPTGTLLDLFTPFNWSFLSTTDADASMGALVVPNTNLVLGGGKPGLLYVLDRDNLGHHNPADDSQIVQSLQASSSGRMYGTPIYWDSPTYGPAIYTYAASDPLKAFRLVNGRFETVPAAESPQHAEGGMPGGMMSLSANGSGPGTGIVWTAMSSNGDANNQVAPGVVRAHDAGDVTRQLWNSEQNPGRDRLGNFSKFSPPTIANGKVYAPTFSNKLVVYGLLGAGPGNEAPVINAGADQAITLPNAATFSAIASDDGNPNPPGALTASWISLSGPGSVTFTPPNALTTSASFSTAGTYILRLTVSDSAAAVTDDVTITVNPAMGTGSGLTGLYFNDPGTGAHFVSLVRARQDATVDFDWADGSPDPAVQPDNFSVRWTGYVQAPVTGNHTFRTVSNDGVRLSLNGQLLIDNWTDHDTTTDVSAPVALVSGSLYPITLEFYDHNGPAEARLLWSYPGQGVQVIPQSHLYLPAVVNQPPAVNAGADQAITLPGVAQLRGTASDDGLPIPPGALTVRWSKISGREDDDNPVIIANPDALETTVTFSAPDVYVFRLTVSDGGVTVSDDVTINVSLPPDGNGTGLTGQYFTGLNFETLTLTRTDPAVNFDWGVGSPGSGLPTDDFSIRWTGQVQAVATGNYIFSASSDDGVRLWVNGQLVIDNWVNQPETTVTSGPVSLVADALYDIRFEFFDHEEDAIVRLSWTYPGQATTIIPQSQLYPAVAQQNQAPVVNAGADQTISLPAAASLAATASDDGQPNPPGTLTTTWSRVSGPGTVTFGNANALNTTATFTAAGTHVLRLTASDGTLSTIDEMSVVVNPATTNQAPTANAGSDQTITLPAAASLAGTASDDGLPTPPGTLTTTWSRVSGLGSVTFGNASALSTTATFSAAGTHVLRLTASDSVLTTTDDLTVTVNAANQAPTANAGSDQTITLPAAASLAGTAGDDGLPTPPGTLTTTWNRVSGPGTVTFGNANALSTTATFSAAGTHVLRLTASDGTLTATDDVTVTVNSPGPGGTGTGLTGSYHNDPGNGSRFTTLVLTRVDATVDFDWVRNAPVAGVQSDNFSVRWTGDVQPPVSGSFTFVTMSDDGVRLWVNEQLIIDNWGNHPLTINTSAPVPLVGGVRYPIRLEFWDGVKNAVIRLHWNYPGQATQAIPQSQLFPVAGPGSHAPVVNAGTDQTITLPATASLAGTASDDGQPNPPGALTTTWSRVSGPGTVTFGNANALSTTATFSAAGTHVLRLTASDSALSTADDLTVTVNATNQAPVVNAGTDQTITLPATASLAGTAGDDGLPNPPGTVTTTWSRVSGPGTVTFGNANALNTTATFSAAGTQVLRLTVSDSVLTTTDDVTITVNVGNQAPTANAGSDQTITLPAAASLAGTAGDDGLPNPPGTLTTTWSRVSGPGTVTFGNANALSTTATFSAAGTQVLRLTVFDSVLTTTDDVSVTVNAGGGTPGTGLTGQYYNGITLSTLRHTRVDPTVNFDWAEGAPAPNVPVDRFSVRWTGQVRAPVTGNYVFSTVSDDGVRLWVNGQQVINNWTDHGTTTNTSASIALVAGVSYAIRLEFYDRDEDAVIRLQWSFPGQSTQAIPQSQLFP